MLKISTLNIISQKLGTFGRGLLQINRDCTAIPHWHCICCRERRDGTSAGRGRGGEGNILCDRQTRMTNRQSEGRGRRRSGLGRASEAGEDYATSARWSKADLKFTMPLSASTTGRRRSDQEMRKDRQSCWQR